MILRKKLFLLDNFNRNKKVMVGNWIFVYSVLELEGLSTLTNFCRNCNVPLLFFGPPTNRCMPSTCQTNHIKSWIISGKTIAG